MTYLNKTIYFIGDSIIASGYFFDYVRAYLDLKNINIKIFNKGVPGYRADLFQNLRNEEFEKYTPDYALVNYGINDIGVWLYDKRKKITKELKGKRQDRIEKFLESLEEIVVFLQKRGIKPILSTPFAVNQKLTEKSDISSVFDNKEKEDYIDDGFYKRKTFKNINRGIEIMRNKIEKLAGKLGLEFWDFYAYTKRMMNSDDYSEDGIHFNREGHFKLAEFIVKKLIEEKMIPCDISDKILQIRELENLERNYYYLKYNEFYFEKNEVLNNVSLVKEALIKNECSDDRCYDDLINYINDADGNKEKLLQIILD